MTTTHLLYLHGFRSSPLSAKAQMTVAAVAQRHSNVVWQCPALDVSPQRAMADVLRLTADWPRATMGIVGSSLGGFYATWLAERLGCKAVVLNPAVHPARDLAKHLGDQTVWQDPEQHFVFEARYIAEMRALEVPHISLPERYFAVIAKGDEVLDWREMHSHYAQASVRLLSTSDHGLSDYAEHLDTVLEFLDLC